MIRVAVVEDEDSFANVVKEYLLRFGKEENIDFEVIRFHDGYEIADGYAGGIDVIFMDIEMGLMDGMEAAEQIREKDEQVVIVFITNMAQYALKGYKVNALDYVLKPIEYEVFAQTLRKALRVLARAEDKYIMVSMKEGMKKVRIMDIGWIESRGHRLTFHVREKQWETTVYSMKEMENRLAEEGFKRCNSGSLVNLKRVTGILNGCVEVDGEQLAVSRGRKNEFMSALVSYMTE